MKKLVTNYTFDASAQEIDAPDDFSTLEKILLITNVTDNIIIYNFADPAKGGALATTTLTLDFDTTSMSDTDDLQIFVQDNGATQSVLLFDSSVNGLTSTGGALDVNIATNDGMSIQDGTDPDLKATVLDLSTTNPLVTALVDGDGNGVTTADGVLVNLGTNNDVVVSGDVAVNSGSITVTNLAAEDLDTGGGTDDKNVTGLIGAASGGSQVIPGTTTDGLLVNLGANNDVTVTSGAVTETNSSAIKTAVELVDDTVATLGTTTYTEATTKGITIGAVRRDADTTLVNTTNEVSPLQVDANGRLKVEAFSGETLPVSLSSTTVTGTVAVTQSGTWDEVGINDSGNSITVDYATTGSGTATGALRVELPTNGTGTVGLNAGTNAIGKLAANSGVDIGDVDVTTIAGIAPAFNTGTRSASTQRVTIATDDLVPVSIASVPSHAVTNAGTFVTQENGAALTAMQLIDDTVFVDDAAFTVGTSKLNAMGLLADESSTDSVDEGDVGAPRMTLNRQAVVTVRPNATGEGLDIYRSIDLDETEEEVKATAGKIYGWSYHNLSGSYRYLKFYNATAASTTVGTTTPIMTIPVKGDVAANVEFTNGIPFSTALSIAVTTGLLDNDTGAPGANEFVCNILYK